MGGWRRERESLQANESHEVVLEAAKIYARAEECIIADSSTIS